MRKGLQKLLSGVLSCTLALSLFAQPVMAIDSGLTEEKTESYPILESYLAGKRKGIAQQNDEEIVRIIIEVEADRMAAVKEGILHLPETKLHYTYETLFKGYSLDIRYVDIEKLTQLPGVKRIRKSHRLVPQTMNAKKLTQVIEAKTQFAAQYGVNGKLDGRGMLIATLDSGVDLDHPDMRIDDDAKADMKIKDIKSPFSEKVPFAFNYFNASHAPVHEPPHTTPHGMHVAGILAGNSPNQDGFKGIAPNAQLLVYKVITYNKSTKETDPSEIEYIGEDAQYNAMEDAILRGADVISLSIGSYGAGSKDDLWQQVLESAHRKGVVVVAAMGNWGSSSSESTYDRYTDIKYDMQDLSSSVSVAANSLAIGVGSTRNQVLDLGRVHIGEHIFAYTDLSRYNNKAVPEDETTLGSRFRGRKLLPDEALTKSFMYVGRGMKETYSDANVRDKIIIADRGGEAVKEKILRFLKKGAAGVIVLNAVTDFSRGDAFSHPIVSFDHLTIDSGWAISLSRTDGLKLLETIENQQPLTIEFKPDKVPTQLLQTTGISGFSSFGPNYDLELKPDIVAPGENIVSTGHRGYVIMQGTSMASPHVAGLSTLLLQKIKKIKDPYINSLNIADVNKIMLMNTANIVLDHDGLQAGEEALPYLPRRQGAGQADLLKAFATKVLVTSEDKGAASLKEIGDVASFRLKVYNFGDERQTFAIKTSPVLTQTLKPRRLKMEDRDFETQTLHSKVLQGASVQTPEQVIVEPHGTAYIPVTLNVAQANQEFVEGYVQLISQSETHPNLNIPYLAFKGEWNESQIIDQPQWEEASLTKYAKLRRFVKEDDHERTIEFAQLGQKKAGTEIDDPATYSLNSDKQVSHDATVVHKVAPVLIFLRDTYLYEVAIVKEATPEAEPVRILNTAHFPEKYVENKVVEYGEDYAKTVLEANPAAIWDGQVYNPHGTGSWETQYMKSAEEGQYYYRIRAKKSENDDWQYVYMPIRVDNTEPSVAASVNRDTGTVTLTVRDRETAAAAHSHGGTDLAASEGSGVEFVGATLNNRPITLTKVDEETYTFKLPKDNLTTAYLSVEAMDYAGNPVAVRTHLAKNHISLLNRRAVAAGTSKELEIALTDAKITNIQLGDLSGENNAFVGKDLPAKKVGDKMLVTIPQNAHQHLAVSYELADGTHMNEVFALRHQAGTIRGHAETGDEDDTSDETAESEDETEEEATADEDTEEPDTGDDSAASDEDEDDSDTGSGSGSGSGSDAHSADSSYFNFKEDIDILNGFFVNYSIGNKHNLIQTQDEDEESLPVKLWKYKAFVWLREGQEAWLSMINTHDNQINNRNYFDLIADEHGNSMFKVEGEGDWAEVWLPLKPGDNMLKLRVFDTNQDPTAEEQAEGYPGHQLYTNKYTIFFDGTPPVVELGKNVVIEEDDEEEEAGEYIPGNLIHGKIYTKGAKGRVTGIVSDDLDEWSVNVNGDIIKRGGLKGHFGHNQKSFAYNFKAVAGEYVHVIAKDAANNERKFELRVVVDEEAPEVTVEDADALTLESTLTVEATDDNDERTLSIKVNNQDYTTGQPIKNYAVNGSNYYHIKITATDLAGNMTEKVIEIGDAPSQIGAQTLKKDTYTLAELSNVDNLFAGADGIKAEILEKSVVDKDGNLELTLRFTDAFGHTKDQTFSIRILSESGLDEDVSLDHELKKEEFKVEDLSDFGDLFDLREGVSYTIDNKLDLSAVREDTVMPLTVTFYSARGYYRHTYNILVKADPKAMEDFYKPEEGGSFFPHPLDEQPSRPDNSVVAIAVPAPTATPTTVQPAAGTNAPKPATTQAVATQPTATQSAANEVKPSDGKASESKATEPAKDKKDTKATTKATQPTMSAVKQPTETTQKQGAAGLTQVEQPSNHFLYILLVLGGIVVVGGFLWFILKKRSHTER